MKRFWEIDEFLPKPRLCSFEPVEWAAIVATVSEVAAADAAATMAIYVPTAAAAGTAAGGLSASSLMAAGGLGLAGAGLLSSMSGASSRDAYNQQILQQQADMAKAQAASQEATSRTQSERLMAKQRAGFAASGLTFAGSPLSVITDTAAEAELEALRIRYGGTVAQYNTNVQQGLSTFEKEEAKRNAMFNFGSTLLTAGSLLAPTGSGASMLKV